MLRRRSRDVSDLSFSPASPRLGPLVFDGPRPRSSVPLRALSALSPTLTDASHAAAGAMPIVIRFRYPSSSYCTPQPSRLCRHPAPSWTPSLYTMSPRFCPRSAIWPGDPFSFSHPTHQRFAFMNPTSSHRFYIAADFSCKEHFLFFRTSKNHHIRIHMHATASIIPNSLHLTCFIRVIRAVKWR
jgi:hypothetical protein